MSRAPVTPTEARPFGPGDRAADDARVTVLLVEDNPGDAALLQDLMDAPMSAAGAPPRVIWVQRLAEAQACVRERRAAGARLDLVLLDLSLPDARGLDTVERMRAVTQSVPIVILTGLDDEGLAVHALQAGAQDYLVKGTVTQAGLRRAALHAIERQRLLDAEQRATRARDMVLGIVAHDLRNPISTIKMCTTALGTDGADTAELSSVIRRSAEWMEHIIRDLLDVTAIEAGRLAVDTTAVPVADVVARTRELYAPLAAEKGVTLTVHAAPDADVLADADRLLQALGNLLGNAIKFTPGGGHVSLAVTPNGRMLRFAVTDTGPGIAAEHLPHVFDRFWQARETRRAGAGLGLAIVKGIVEAHGGEVGVESTPGEGAGFWLEVPGARSEGER